MKNNILDNTNYCYSCFCEIQGIEDFCPFCGADTKTVSKNERILLPGTILNGKYLIGQAIGEGGFGITYRGMDLNLKLKVAIKEYFPPSLATRDVSTGDTNIHIISGNAEVHFQKGLEDFTKEANRLSQFTHLDGVVSVLNFFFENNSAYMVMEYIDGISLKGYLEKQNGKLDWRETLRLLHPIIISLSAIHNTGIIHRDISPDNIMMTKQGQMILIDFGSARNVSTNQQNTVVLKKGYAPIEQYQTNGNQGTWTDVYSICATIYRMISGTKPMDALDVAQGNMRIPGVQIFDHSIPKFVNTAVQQGMSVRPENRIQTMKELEDCLYKGRRYKGKKQITSRTLIHLGFMLLPIAVLFLGIGIWKLSVEESDSIETVFYNNDVITDEVYENDAVVDEVYEHIDNEIDVRYESYIDSTETAFKVEENNGRLFIVDVDFSLSEIVVPSKIYGMPVYEISGMGTNVVSVVIKNGTERIAEEAFRNCVYLEKVYIPASVVEIGDNAFANCLSLTEIIVSPENDYYYSKDGHLYSVTNELIF